MKYSVIIPAYQCVKTLEATIESVYQSGLRDYEIIIIDDGSTDGTTSLCQSLAKRDFRIHVQSRENKGVSATRNEGLKFARGEYVWFLDADDSVDNGSLKKVVDVIEEYGPDVVIFGMSFDYYHKGQLYRRDTLCYKNETMYSKKDIGVHFEELYDCNVLTPIWNKFIKRSVIDENHIKFQEDMFLLEDFVFSLELLFYCSTAYIISAPIYRYRQPEKEGNAYKRLKRVHDLQAFMEPIAYRLQKYPDVLNKVYFMLLWQKLYLASVSEIHDIANHLQTDQYQAKSEANQKLYEALLGGKYWLVWLWERKKQIRHVVASIVKKNGFYRKIKYSNMDIIENIY